ncbi:MAG TPA: hypothetical protein PKM63_16670 [Panacibacter sp.]|nr:hypothetical protein [Panacibacter sp.]HNP45927.1 hypothetical protein [Panacibacter sp.]
MQIYTRAAGYAINFLARLHIAMALPLRRTLHLSEAGAADKFVLFIKQPHQLMTPIDMGMK